MIPGPTNWMRARAGGRSGIGDPALVAVAGLLTVLGIAMIYSAGQVELPSAVSGVWRRQLVWAVGACGAFYLASRVPLRWLEWASPWLYAASICLLILVLVIGTGPNTRSWLSFGPVNLQPAELAKLATILMLARDLTGHESSRQRLAGVWRPLAIVLAPFGLVLVQPDLGSALIFSVILICALVWAGVPLASIFLLLSPAVSLVLGFSAVVWGVWFVAVVAFLYLRRTFALEAVAVGAANLAAGALTLPLWNSLAEYQQNRLLVFLNPGIDPRGAGWHLIQSKVAIGSGGWFGYGYGNGPQKRLAFLPEQHTDFIFSVVGEELGFVGVVAFLLLFAWFLSRVLRVARRSTNEFGSIAAFCLFGVWTAHVAINVGMTVGLMPVTGLPLPFLSYGGSFLFMLFAGLGVVSRVGAER
ncbi:MAG: rod shape-determining protein RodA [Gemmatimonadota bacterium]